MTAILRRRTDLRALLEECRRLGRQLVAKGGATIETPVEHRPGGPQEGAAIVARTVIQPDGDVVCFVTDRYCEDADLRAAHGLEVAAWYARAQSTMGEAVAVMRSFSRALALVVSLLVGGLGGLTSSGALRLLIPAVVAPLLFGAVGVTARVGMRRLIRRTLRHR